MAFTKLLTIACLLFTSAFGAVSPEFNFLESAPFLNNFTPDSSSLDTASQQLGDDLLKGFVIQNVTTSYECPAGYVFMDYNYLTMKSFLNFSYNTWYTCRNIPAGTKLRLSGGGSIIHDADGCKILAVDPEVIETNLCAKYTLGELTQGDAQCGNHSTLINAYDSASQDLCSSGYIKNGWYTRAGPYGLYYSAQIDLFSWSCAYLEYTVLPISQRTCVSPKITEVLAVNSTAETLCPQGKSLVNSDEIAPSLGDYCNLPGFQGIRLAGGAAVSYDDFGGACYIHHPANDTRGSAGCADVDR